VASRSDHAAALAEASVTVEELAATRIDQLPGHPMLPVRRKAGARRIAFLMWIKAATGSLAW